MKLLFALACLAFVFVPGLSAAESIFCTPAQAADHLGKYATVTGIVAEVHTTAKGNVMLQFGGQYPKQVFSVVIFAGDRSKFDDLNALLGKTVSVTGSIRLYQEKPEIIVKRRDQLKVQTTSPNRG